MTDPTIIRLLIAECMYGENTGIKMMVRRLVLYFDFELSLDEVVEVMILAMLYPKDWITAKEMVRIAESLQSID